VPKSFSFGEFRPVNITDHCQDPQKALPCAKSRHMSHSALKSVQSLLLWTDFNKIPLIERHMADVIISVKFLCWKITRLEIYGVSNFGISHWNGWPPLQQYCATAQPVITLTSFPKLPKTQRPKTSKIDVFYYPTVGVSGLVVSVARGTRNF